MTARITLWFTKLRREEGQAAVEYGVLLALILVVAIVAIGLLGGEVNDAFNAVVNKIPGGS